LDPDPSLSEEFEDTKGVIRIRISKKNRQHNGQKKKNRQHNGQKKKNRQHNGQKTEVQKDEQGSTKRTHKTKDRVTRTPLKTEGK
jgi:hypothetical protein